MTVLWNNFKTAMLLGLLFGLLLWLGSMWGTTGLTMAFIFGGAMNVVAFFFSDKIALAAMKAKPADPNRDHDLITMVKRLADNANLPMPKVYICPQQAPNAFATGRSPRHAAVAVTHGAMQLLSYDELEGVMAHELAHVKNRDTLISTVAATIAGALSYLGWMALFFGGNREGGGLAALLMIILAPIAAAIVQAAISRSREFVADADGARIAGTPAGLINALQKLESYGKRVPLHNGEMASHNHMFIVNPLSGASMSNLFSTHPATQQRIAKLRELQ